MSNELFEQWALDPKGGNWATNPTILGYDYHASVQWKREQAAFTAGIEAERNRLRALVEGEIDDLEFNINRFKGLQKQEAWKHYLSMCQKFIRYLTDPQPATDKTETA